MILKCVCSLQMTVSWSCWSRGEERGRPRCLWRNADREKNSHRRRNNEHNNKNRHVFYCSIPKQTQLNTVGGYSKWMDCVPGVCLCIVPVLFTVIMSFHRIATQAHTPPAVSKAEVVPDNWCGQCMGQLWHTKTMYIWHPFEILQNIKMLTNVNNAPPPPKIIPLFFLSWLFDRN